jgi:TonB-dependent SusC/RagA subfamily outer membrane receptor
MKYILVITLFFLNFMVNAQMEKTDTVYGKAKNKGIHNVAATATPIVLRCPATISNSEPLIVVDGLLYESDQLKNLNPAEIISIEVLKDAAASAIYGYRAANGVIIITTNRSDKDFVLISDADDHSPLAGATCLIRSKDNYFDSTIAVSDSAGKIYRKQFLKASGFEVIVTSVGYTKQSKIIRTSDLSKKQEIEMTRDIKKCNGVTVMSTEKTFHCFLRMVCVSTINKTGKNPGTSLIDKIYPDPLMKGQQLTIEINSPTDQQIMAKLINFNGQLIKQEAVKLNKGNNSFQLATDSRWSAGVYIFQLTDVTGKLLKQDKIVVQ